MEVEELASKISAKRKQKIQDTFEKNAEYFSANEKHHPDYMFQLMEDYNEYFEQENEPFIPEDVGCEECQATMIKFWSFIIYDLWERKII